MHSTVAPVRPRQCLNRSKNVRASCPASHPIPPHLLPAARRSLPRPSLTSLLLHTAVITYRCCCIPLVLWPWLDRGVPAVGGAQRPRKNMATVCKRGLRKDGPFRHEQFYISGACETRNMASNLAFSPGLGTLHSLAACAVV